MSSKLAQMVDLELLSETAFSAAQFHMAKLKAEEKEIRGKLEALSLKSNMPDAHDLAESPNRVSEKVNLNWSIWIDTKRRDLNSELSKNLSHQAAERSGLALAFAKRETIKQLVTKLRSATAMRHQRQAYFK